MYAIYGNLFHYAKNDAIHTAGRVVTGTEMPIHIAEAECSLFQLTTRYTHSKELLKTSRLKCEFHNT